MIRVLFVCHGNICRSPMAEFIMKDLVNKKGQAHLFMIDSRALTKEEIGNNIYPPAYNKLREKGIPVSSHRAKKIIKDEYDTYDYIIGMDTENMYDLDDMFGLNDKCYKLLDFIDNSHDISDPWYTRDFEKAYNDIYKGIIAFYSFLEKNNKIY